MKWISVTESLPKENVLVLAFDPRYGIAMAKVSHEPGEKPPYSFFLTDGTYTDDQNITHWMPLPEPPAV